MARLGVTGLAFCELALASSEARAQPTTGAPPPHAGASSEAPTTPLVTMPVPKRNEGAAYPKQALDMGIAEATQVPVLITVSATGAVLSAVVESPVGHGFDEAAVAAARAMEFDPATRNGVPVSVRTRVVFKFVPPASALGGRVISIEHGPVAGAAIAIRDAAGREQTFATGADGAWRADDLAPGAYHVSVSAPGLEPHESDETLRPGEETNVVDRLASTTPSPPSRAGASAEVVQEVHVQGERPPREVVKRTLEQRELNRIPGTSGDALQSLQNLPGVARTPSLSGLLVVRGSAPNDSVYFVDGTPIPLVFHFGGIFSVLPTEIIDRIDFYPGNFSAQFGRAMGAVVDVGLASPKSDRLHAMVEVNLIDARVLAQGPVLDTGWRFAVAGRRSYVDTWLGPVLTATGASVSVAPVYSDYQAILERDLSSRSSLRFAFFGSDDRLAIILPNASASEPALAGALSNHTGFWRAQGLYKNRISDSTELRLVGAVGQDFVDLSLGALAFKLTTVPISGRLEVAHKLDKSLTMNVGLDMLYTPYTLSALLPPLPRAGEPPAGPLSGQVLRKTDSRDALYVPATYAEWEATPWRGGRIVPGIRLDYTKDTKVWDLSPRVVVRQDVTTGPRTTLKAGAGLFTQPPQPQETNAVFGVSGLGSNRAYQYDVGAEREFSPHIEGSIDTFYKQLDHLVTAGVGNTGSGVIFGAEFLLRYKPDAHFFGWLSYTLSRSTRRDAPGAPLRLSLYDETHVLAVLGSYRLGNGWELGARFRLVSGFMYTPHSYGFYDENTGTYVALQAYPVNGSRLPFFHSLDIRVDKSWKMSWGKLGVYLDVRNVYNNANIDGVSYDFTSTHQSYANDLPILPSLGIRAEL